MAHQSELEAMRRAIEFAAASPDVSPNPKVACILLDSDGVLLATGVHQGPGQDHAEVVALKVAGDEAKGATAIVTLEPCNHTGRTGPCSQALIDAGVARVVFAVSDPNDEAAGGAEALRAAGVEVEGPVSEIVADARALNREWLHIQENRRPWVIAKVAATLDGKVAASDGTSQWITGKAARELGHELRGRVDAIAVGTGTVKADNPQLTDRRPEATAQPLRVVIGKSELDSGLAVFDDAAETVQIESYDPSEILQQLFDRGVRTLLLEGGPTLERAFFTADLVDELAWFTAPKLLGIGTDAVADLGIATLREAIEGKLISVTQAGDDVLLRISLRHN